MSETARGWLLVSPIWTYIVIGVIFILWKTLFKKEKPVVSPEEKLPKYARGLPIRRNSGIVKGDSLSKPPTKR